MGAVFNMITFDRLFIHYFNRFFKDPMNLLFVFLPLVFVLINGLVNQQTEEIAGYDVVLTASSIVLMLSFQFFFMESFVMVYTKDQKTSMRFRLGVSPVPKGHFFTAMASGSYLYALLQATAIIVITSLVFPTDWGNLAITGLTVLMMSCFTHLLALFVCLVTKTNETARSAVLVLPWIFMTIGGGVGLEISGFTLPKPIQLLFDYSPITLATNAIQETTVLAKGIRSSGFYLACLSGYLVVTVLLITIVKGKEWNR